jgi:hypothetical protein
VLGRVGPRARGHPAASWAEWKATRAQVLARAGWHRQACGARRRRDVHLVVKRSQGGSDFDLDQLVALCRWCHDQTDAPYERGRLIVTPLGDGQFRCDVVKRAARESADHSFCPRGQNCRGVPPGIGRGVGGDDGASDYEQLDYGKSPVNISSLSLPLQGSQ